MLHGIYTIQVNEWDIALLSSMEGYGNAELIFVHKVGEKKGEKILNLCPGFSSNMIRPIQPIYFQKIIGSDQAQTKVFSRSRTFLPKVDSCFGYSRL